MRVTIDRESLSCIVELEDGENPPRKFNPGVSYGGRDPDSSMWYAIKNHLNENGGDWVKKRMWKDGHLMDDNQMYIRMRKPVNGEQLAIYHSAWSIYNAVDRLREDGVIVLFLVSLSGDDE